MSFGKDFIFTLRSICLLVVPAVEHYAACENWTAQGSRDPMPPKRKQTAAVLALGLFAVVAGVAGRWPSKVT